MYRHALARACARTHTQAQTHAEPEENAHVQTRSGTCARARTRARVHTHTLLHILSLTLIEFEENIYVETCIVTLSLTHIDTLSLTYTLSHT